MEDVHDADVGAGEEAQDAEADQEQVLPEDPVEAAEPVGAVPVGDGLDDGGEDEAEEGQAHGAHQRDEGAQVGDGDGDGERHHDQRHADTVLGQVPPRAEPVPHVLPDDLHGHVELQAVREEDGHRDHQLHALTQAGNTNTIFFTHENST